LYIRDGDDHKETSIKDFPKPSIEKGDTMEKSLLGVHQILISL